MASNESGLSHSGWMVKKGKRRWFALKKGLLMWFTEVQAQVDQDQANGSLLLKRCRVVEDTKTKTIVITPHADTGEKPLELESNPVPSKKEAFIDYEDTVGQTSLSSLERMSKRNKKKAKPGNNNNPNSNNQSNTKNTGNGNSKAETSETKPENAPKNNPSQPRPQSSKPKPNFKKPSPPNTPANPDAANSPSPPVEPNDPANNTANKPNSTTKKTHFKPKPNNKGKNFIAPKPKDNDDKAK